MWHPFMLGGWMNMENIIALHQIQIRGRSRWWTKMPPRGREVIRRFDTP
jgi:hypothetical protein